MAEKIIQVNVLTQYKLDYIRYLIYVNMVRMVPDVKDGLKTVHRRILGNMYIHHGSSRQVVKTNKVVGNVMGEFHPHGNTAIEDTIKPMVNEFEINLPLIKGQGNWGSAMGDKQAASRYTEIVLSDYTLDCIIADMKDVAATVEWRPTYDGSMMEPAYLPASVPNLLINGAFGIGIGVKTEIPKHNINEVIDAAIKLINNPNATIELIPEHCQKVTIIGSEWKKINNTGRGHYYARGIIDILPDNRTLLIRSLPDMVFLDSVIEGVEDLVKSGMIHVADMVDETTAEALAGTGDYLRYLIVLKKDSDANYARDLIYKKTQIEKRCTVNMEVLDGIKPMRLSYKAYLQYFIEFRKLIKFIKYQNMYQEVMTKVHEKEYYIEIANHPDFAKIKKYVESYAGMDDNVMIEYLIKNFNVTDLQAKFVINVKMKNMSIGYINKYTEDVAAWRLEGDSYMAKILDEKLLLDEIIDELKEAKRKYGKPRKCNVLDAASMSSVPKGEFKVIVSENNFIKKVPVNFDHNSSKSKAIAIIKGCNSESILLFDEFGRVFRLAINKIPMGDKSSPGQDIRTILKNLTSNIIKVIYEPKLIDLSKLIDKYYMVTLTEQGMVKKLDLEDFLNVPPSGVKFINMDDDRVVAINMVHGELDIVVYSDAKASRMNMYEIPHQKRNTKGLRAMSGDEKIDGMSIIHPNSTDALIITEKGFINRFDIVALPRLLRNKPGSTVIKLSKGDRIKSIINFQDTGNESLKITLSGNVEQIVPISGIAKVSSISPGKREIATNNEHIISVQLVK